jgi:spoIIIJ-associated protein
VSETVYAVDTVGPRIDAFLDKVLKSAGMHLKYQITPGTNVHPDFENPDVVVKFSGSDVDILLENKAEVMLALEHLTMEALGMPQEHHSRLCFDANDYRMLRVEELRLSALTAAERVKKTHSLFRFNPMNSRERRILHLALRNETAVRSESAGTGPFRQVVVYPADMPTPPEQPDAGRRPYPPRGGDRGGDRDRGRPRRH